MREVIQKVAALENLTVPEAEAAMESMMGGKASHAQIGAFLIALKMKGEAVEEIAAFARVMRRRAVAVTTRRFPLVDTCGTGGDGAGTFNISTASAFVAAGAGLTVAKHGNRSVSSRCGSADVLEALGVNIVLDPAEIGGCLDEVGIGFLFAQRLHLAMSNVATPRRELGVRTVFNILGPLTNPAGASHQVIGVYSQDLLELMGEALLQLGAGHSMVIHGYPGVDELTPCGPAEVVEVQSGSFRRYTLDPAELGFPRCSLEDLGGGGPADNARLLRGILEGQTGPRRDAVLLNAAAALVVGGAATDFRHGVALARESIDSGRALASLENLIRYTRQKEEGR